VAKKKDMEKDRKLSELKKESRESFEKSEGNKKRLQNGGMVEVNKKHSVLYYLW